MREAKKILSYIKRFYPQEIEIFESMNARDRKHYASYVLRKKEEFFSPSAWLERNVDIGMSFKQIAKKLGISQQEVVEIYNNAMEKVKKIMTQGEYKEYFEDMAEVFHKKMENLKSVQSGSESSTKDSNLDSQIHDSHREVVCDDFKGCGVRGSLLNINDQAECEHSIKSTQNTSETSEGGRPKIEYIITLELAKHIAMLEKNEIGRHIRQYFIDFENTHRESSNHLSNPHIKGLLDIAKSQIAAIEKTQKNLEIVAKKVQVLESTKRLESWQERALSDSVKAKVYELTNGREVSPKVVSAYYRAIYKRLKGKYYVARYSEIPCVKFDEALHYVECISNDDLIS